jgi:mycothiol synthase
MTTTQQQTNSGFELRAAAPEDADTISALFDAAAVDAVGFRHREAERVQDFFARWPPGSEEAATQVAVTDRGGVVVGAALLPPAEGRTLALVAVHPEGRGQGIGGALADWLALEGAGTVRTHPSKALTLIQRVFASNHSARSLLEMRGWQRSRSLQRMERALTETDADSPGDSGLSIRPVVPEREMEALLLTEYLAFREDESYDPAAWALELARRRRWLAGNAHHDPAVWFVALADGAPADAALEDEALADEGVADEGGKDEGTTIAGVCLCTLHTVERAELAWINRLAVRVPWRHRGIGQALLKTAFAELARRGKRCVGLHVIAGNEPAVRVYRRAGMSMVPHLQLDEYALATGVGPEAATKAERNEA